MSDTTPTPAPAVVPAIQPVKAAPWWWPQMRDILAFLSTLIFAATFVLPVIVKGAAVDADLKGAIIIQWGGVMGWFFGSSKSSAAKDQTISDMAAKQ